MQISKQLKAFLDMIAVSEGTAKLGDSGYNVLVGGTLFNRYADHPRKPVFFWRLKIKSSAAGRYQLLARYFDHYKIQLKLKDFSPESQDKIAIQQIRERKALADIERGHIATAIHKTKNIWASFPGAGYKQNEHTLEYLIAVFKSLGGVVRYDD